MPRDHVPFRQDRTSGLVAVRRVCRPRLASAATHRSGRTTLPSAGRRPWAAIGQRKTAPHSHERHSRPRDPAPRQPVPMTLRCIRSRCTVHTTWMSGTSRFYRSVSSAPGASSLPAFAPGRIPAIGHEPCGHIPATSSSQRLGRPSAALITECNAIPAADRGHVCSMFARMSGYGPVQAGTAWARFPRVA
jgi:hypothetical protein